MTDMTKAEAFAIAQANCLAFHDAELAAMLGKGPEVNEQDFGHRHGWFTVGGYTFPDYELRNLPRACPVQQRFAYL